MAFYVSPVGIGNFTSSSGTALAYIYVDIDVNVGGNFYYWDWYSQYYAGYWYNGSGGSQAFPWYFPSGDSVSSLQHVHGPTDLGTCMGTETGRRAGLSPTPSRP